MTPWRHLDPRSKTLAALLICGALTLASADRAAWGLLPAMLLVATAGLDRRRLGALVRAVLFLGVVALVVNGLLVPGERMGPSGLGWLRPTREGLQVGATQFLRLAALAGVTTWLVVTTGILDLASSLEWSVRGLPALRRRVHALLFPIVLALGSVTALQGEARRLLAVDRLRRGPRTGFARVRRVAALVPLWLVLIVERAEALALALELRGYRPGRERGFARAWRFGVGDWALVTAAGSVAFLVGVP